MTTYTNRMKHKTIKQKTVKHLMAVAFLGLLSFAIIPQAHAENCDPQTHRGVFNPKITVNDSDIIAGGSQAVGMGNAQKVVDFGVSRVDVDGFDINAVNAPSRYTFKKADSITEPLNETFQFFTYTDQNDSLVKNNSGPTFYNAYCQGRQVPPYGAVNHQQNIVDYLTNNAQKFFVNGEPAVSDYKKN